MRRLHPVNRKVCIWSRRQHLVGQPSDRTRHDETGAVLVLALMFMVVTGLIVTGLTAWSGNDITNIGNLKLARITVYTADSAIQDAISNMRYSYPSSPFGGFAPSCTSPTPQPFALDDPNDPNPQITVQCGRITGSPASSQSRKVTLSAYPSSDFCQGGGGSWALCNSSDQPYVQATVAFDDIFSGSNGSSSSNDCTSPTSAQTTCGLGMTVLSWVVKPGLT